MTPKEKASELFVKYYAYRSNTVAKLMAEICVEEVIGQWEYIDTYLADLGGQFNPNLKYWYEVKKELEAMK